MMGDFKGWLQGWLEGLLDAIVELFMSLLDNFIGWLDSVVRALFDIIYQGIAWIVVDGFQTVSVWLASIERPDIYTQAESLVCSNWPAVGGIYGSLDFGGPLMVMFAGLSLRFLIRRIPVIG